MDIQQEKERLLQAESIKWLERKIHPLKKVTVYMSESLDQETSRDIYPALIPSGQIKKVLSDTAWGLSEDDHRDAGIEPLVITRSFYGIRDEYVEIAEEFRLFHNLWQEKNQYIEIDEEGDEHVIAVVEPRQVKIRLQEIRQFLAVKEMHLSIQLVHQESSTYTLEELGLMEGKQGQQKGDLYCWDLFCGEVPFMTTGETKIGTLSLLRGKRLIEPLPKSKSRFWGFSEKTKKYEDFIIGVDDDGNEVTYTCNPKELTDLGGIHAAPGAPNYLTPVSFSKDVLDKYYASEKYEVEKSIVRCGSLWSVIIDNDHDDKVVVWLGDIGSSLSHKEQLHWRSYNIPSPTGVSETYFRQQLLVQPADSSRPEHTFQRRYKELQKACQNHLGWQLFLPLESNDKYHLQNIRVPSSNSQPEFDGLVLGLAKVLIESLNTGKLRELAGRQSPNKSIDLLAATLKVYKVTDADEHIDFLRKLQNLRSRGSAHRKGRNYEQVLAGFKNEGDDFMTTFKNILLGSVAFLDFLIRAVNQDCFRETQ